MKVHILKNEAAVALAVATPRDATAGDPALGGPWPANGEYPGAVVRGASTPASTRADRFLEGQHFQSRRVLGAAVDASRKLSGIHGGAPVPAREPLAPPDPFPEWHGEVRRRRMRALRRRHSAGWRARPADPGHRNERPHRVQRAGAVADGRHASRAPRAGDASIECASLRRTPGRRAARRRCRWESGRSCGAAR